MNAKWMEEHGLYNVGADRYNNLVTENFRKDLGLTELTGQENNRIRCSLSEHCELPDLTISNCADKELDC